MRRHAEGTGAERDEDSMRAGYAMMPALRRYKNISKPMSD